MVPTGSPSPTSSPTPSPTPALNQDLLAQRMTVLVVGIDLNERREREGATANTDSLILASVSADQSEIVMISLPRDTVDIPLPDGSVWSRKVNAIYAEQGIEALVGAAETLFGVPIDHHVVIDMDDLMVLVEAVGGVTVDVAEPLSDPLLDLSLEAGRQTLDAGTALDYVRTRVDTDYGRAERQQQVVMALVEELVDPAAEIDISELIDGLESLETDLPVDELPTLVEIARRAQEAQVTSEVLRPTRFITFEGSSAGRGYILVPDVEEIRAFARELIGAD
jgi:LCP family protein required for cell wall assembly